MSEPVLDVAEEEKISDQEDDKRDVVKIRRTVVSVNQTVRGGRRCSYSSNKAHKATMFCMFCL